MREKFAEERRTKARGIEAGAAIAACIYQSWEMAEKLLAEVVREIGKIGAVMVRLGRRRAAVRCGGWVLEIGIDQAAALKTLP